MIQVSLNPRMIQSAVQKLTKWKAEKEGKIIKRTTVAGLNIANKAKINLTDQGAVDTGRLRSSVHNRSFNRGMVQTIGVHKEEVAAGTNYAGAIEYGTGPHFVPLPPLLAWAKRKNKLSESKVDVSRKWAIARGVQKAISERGTRPRPYLEPAFEEEVHDYLIDVRRILEA